MKILKNGISNHTNETQKQVCYDCDCEFEYDGSDIKTDDECEFVNCPWCNNKIILNWTKDQEDEKLYPDVFFSDFDDAVHMSDKEVDNMCKRVYKDLEGQEENGYAYEMTGDTIVFGIKEEYDISLFVSRGYEEATHNLGFGWLKD